MLFVMLSLYRTTSVCFTIFFIFFHVLPSGERDEMIMYSTKAVFPCQNKIILKNFSYFNMEPHLR